VVGRKLLDKTSQLIGLIGRHALAMFADKRGQCQYYASEALADISHREEVSSFFRHHLLEQFNGGQPVMCRFVPTVTSVTSLQTVQSTRQATWDQRLPTLQAYANQIAVNLPNRAFFWTFCQ